MLPNNVNFISTLGLGPLDVSVGVAYISRNLVHAESICRQLFNYALYFSFCFGGPFHGIHRFNGSCISLFTISPCYKKTGNNSYEIGFGRSSQS